MPSVSEMKVGKKYRCSSASRRDQLFECVYVGLGDPFVVFRRDDGYEFMTRNCGYFDEHVEPRREFFNAYEDRTGYTKYTYSGPYPSRDSADIHDSRGCYGVLELIHHSDTKIESIFHLVKK